MMAPQALIEFFQKEATEYLDRLDQLLAPAESATPDASAFLTHARALRGSATMTRLEGLPDLASTVERIATGLRDGELRWDQHLHFAVKGALVELRALVQRANAWGDAEQRRSRTQSVALAAVAAGYLATSAPPTSPATQVIPIGRFFPEDGLPAILQRNPDPPGSRSPNGSAMTLLPLPTASHARDKRSPRVRQGRRNSRCPTDCVAPCLG